MLVTLRDQFWIEGSSSFTVAFTVLYHMMGGIGDSIRSRESRSLGATGLAAAKKFKNFSNYITLKYHLFSI